MGLPDTPENRNKVINGVQCPVGGGCAVWSSGEANAGCQPTLRGSGRRPIQLGLTRICNRLQSANTGVP